jgi:GNAT superfamily N-acetyltransferase
VEIVQFGLMREFIGQGLGKYFLQWAIDRAWAGNPERLWLHTCTLDHPAALPNYLKAGFTVFKQEQKVREV